MITANIKRLATLRKKVAGLERVIETELYEELFGIHQRYGFAELESFIKAVKLAARGGGRKAGRPKKVVAAPKIRRRAKITDATRAKVGKLVTAGLSGAKIAKAVGISLPSVHNIKKALGLVKTRKVKAKRVPAKKTPAKKVPDKRAPAKRAIAKKRPAKKKSVVKAPANNAPAVATEPPAPPAAKNG